MSYSYFRTHVKLKIMRELKLFLIAACSIALFACANDYPERSYNQGVNIIPMPLAMEMVAGESFTLNKKSAFEAQSPEAVTIAEFFASKINAATGYNLAVSDNVGAIKLSIEPLISDNKEAYTLSVSTDKVTIIGASVAGLFYGVQSFMQLLPAEIESPTLVEDIVWSAPLVEITDSPRFAYRGVMFDVCRHFVGIEFLKKQIDVLAMLKINHMHWHLTEDQAWRVEIKKYPLLTEIGSVRTEPDGTIIDGYYTQDEIREVVAYAAERFITVVPEFEMPGHFLAAIAAYPHLSCKSEAITPRTIWGVEDVVMCPAKESTFEFIEDVIDELAPLFPGEYFHVGGDECPKTEWAECKACQSLIRQKDLRAKDGHSAEERLQSYVIQRAEEMLAKHNKKLIGWDEILEGGLSKSATVMSWRGESGGIAAAKMGRNVIMSPQTDGLYLNFYQGDNMIEPVTIGGDFPFHTTYSYDPVPDALSGTEAEKYVIGVQANLWSEYMYSSNLVEYQAYPRVAAVAELAWSQPENKDIDDIYRRLPNLYVRLDGHDINYYIAQPEQPTGSTNHIAFTDSTTLNFTTNIPTKMVFTIDGSRPNPRSREYTAPLTFTESATLKIRSVLPSGKMSPTRTIEIEQQKLRKDVVVGEPKAGLKVVSTPGMYLNRTDFEASKEPRIHSAIEHLGQLPLRTGFDNSMRDIEQQARLAQGFIYIAEDGIYHFRSNNNNVWIAGEMLIDNDEQVKRFSRNSRSIALSKGMHRLEVLWLGNIIGGWPSAWDDGALTVRRDDEQSYRYVSVGELFYN